jgi:glyoxylase-like metal-dependent hydrolase (beta-lactamase superfamily II)
VSARRSFLHDRPEGVAPGVVRVTAANPGVMTGPGTNSYLVGDDEIAVVDPGPDDSAHVEALVREGGGRIRWIVVTHTHPDHAPAAAALAERTGAERLGFASRDGFVADRLLADGDVIEGGGWTLTAVHTPGHASNHLCFAYDRLPGAGGRAIAGEGPDGRLLFTGDHVMGGSTVVINPPDGDMARYLDSLRSLTRLAPAVTAFAPGHGERIDDPLATVDALVEHRLAREAKVEAALLRRGTATVEELVPDVYGDVDEARWPIAARSLFAHLRALAQADRVRADDPDDVAAAWHAARRGRRGGSRTSVG